MSSIEKMIPSVRDFFSENTFLKKMLNLSAFIFAAGLILYVLGIFIADYFEPLTAVAIILIWAGLLLSLVKEDMNTSVMISVGISLASIIGWIYLFNTDDFYLTPLLYFLIFTSISILIIKNSVKFAKFRSRFSGSAGKTCKGCGKQLLPDNNFCLSCGAPVTEENSVKKCEKCGSDVLSDTVFCGKCGTKMA